MHCEPQPQPHCDALLTPTPTPGSWLYAYLIDTDNSERGGLGLTHAHAAALNSAFWLAFALVRLFVYAPLAAVVSPMRLLCGTQCVGMVGMLVLLLAPGSVAVAWVGTLMIGVGTSAFFPIGAILNAISAQFNAILTPF